MNFLKNKILIFSFIVVVLLSAVCGIYYFFFYDPNIYLEYGNKDTIFSFKYPNTLVISSEIPTLLEAYPKDIYRPYPVFNISVVNISERENFKFSKDYFDSWLNDKGKILEFKEIKIDNRVAYYYVLEKDGKRIRNIITLPKTSFDGDVVISNTYLLGISYYGFDEKYDSKIFNFLTKTIREDNLVGKMVFYEVDSKLKMITDGVISDGKPIITKQWYFEAKKVFDYWKNKNILKSEDINKIQKIMGEYRIYLD